MGFRERFRAWLKGENKGRGEAGRGGGSSGGGAGRSGHAGDPTGPDAAGGPSGASGGRGGRSGRGRRGRRSSERAAAKAAAAELERFARSRRGVEAFLEPKTAIYSTTVLLVADDGEYLRRPVDDRGQAAEMCDELNIPLYDARKVGYPKRMRDYEAGQAPPRIELSDLPPWPSDSDTSEVEGPPPPPVERERSDGLSTEAWPDDQEQDEHDQDDHDQDDGPHDDGPHDERGGR